MIARHDAPTSLDKPNLWSALAAPLDADATAWRPEGAPVARDGGWYVRYAAHPSANAVRERLDRVVPGEWDLTLELLPPLPARAGDPQECAFKARLQILGVIREDVGTGPDYKTAASDALARAAVRFGIGHELTDREPNWVAVDGPELAEPHEAPAAADTRRAAAAPVRRAATRAHATPVPVEASDVVEPAAGAHDGPENGSANPAGDDPSCPKCSGRMWDNRLTKRNPKAPDYKCRDRSCDGVIWPTRPGEAAEAPAPAPTPAREGGRTRARAAAEPRFDAAPLGGPIDDDDLPF